ncbi:MAG: LiaI-LiaF-like domain-containing protein [Bacteroidota bacterium]
MSDHGGRRVLGIILVLLGVIFLLPSLDLPFLRWENLWPLYIVLGGLAFLTGWIVSPAHEPGLAFVGAAIFLTGVFFIPFAWGMVAWHQMAVWWPVFPFIGGLAFLVLWAAGRGKEPGILVPACGGILTGLAALPLTAGWIAPAVVADWWPAGLIVLGAGILLRHAAGGKG